MEFFVSILILILYTVLIGFIMIYISTLIGTALMLIIPLIGVLIIPERMAEFLSFKLFTCMDGMIAVHNIHVLLAVWAAFLAIVLYTEFLSWYMSYIRQEDDIEETTEPVYSLDDASSPIKLKAENVMGSFSDDEVVELNEMKEMVSNWKNWKGKISAADDEITPEKGNEIIYTMENNIK